jgi:pimeloyl-ACP methyl ester carboxylesterase
MKNQFIAIFVAVASTLAVFGCGKQEQPATAAAAPAATAGSSGEPVEGAPRVAIAADGVHVQYRVYGGGEPALVLIHGWSCDSNYWREQVPVLKQKYTVVTVDLAGHGGTDGSRSAWTIAGFGQDVATAVATVPNRQIVLVGHSMGGPVALEAARLMKSRVIGIVGVDTFNTVGTPKPTKAQVDALVAPFEKDFIGHTRQLVTGHLFGPNADRELANKVAYDMSLSAPRVAVPALRALFEYDYAGSLREISVPVVGIYSDLGPPVNDVRIRKVLPKVHATTISGVGHFLMMEDPPKFNAALESEIQGMLAPAGS